MRQVLPGHGASRGSALGRARVRLPHVLDVAEEHIQADAVEAELDRLHAAIDVVRAEMRALRERLHGALVHEVGEFLDLHALLLDDPELLQGLDALIRTGRYSADYALRLQRDRIAAVFTGMDDAYLRSRIDDIDQVIGRIHAALHRRAADLQGIAGDILVTDNVAPAELAQLQAQGVMAVVTAGGSALSHSAILARSLHLPLVVGAAQALLKVNDGDVLAVDGTSGMVVLEPNADDLRMHRARDARARPRTPATQPPAPRTDAHHRRRRHQAVGQRRIARGRRRGACAGRGGRRPVSHRIPVPATQRTAGRGSAVPRLSRRGARHDRAHRSTIRTLDLGADKADRTGLVLGYEPNPALGLRGVRLSLARDAPVRNPAARDRCAHRAMGRCACWCR